MKKWKLDDKLRLITTVKAGVARNMTNPTYEPDLPSTPLNSVASQSQYTMYNDFPDMPLQDVTQVAAEGSGEQGRDERADDRPATFPSSLGEGVHADTKLLQALSRILKR